MILSIEVIRKELEDKLTERIKEGKELLTSVSQDSLRVSLDKNERAYFSWDEYNKDYLEKALFLNDVNKYKDAGLLFLWKNALENFNTPQDLNSRHYLLRKKIELKVEKLEELRKRLDLLSENDIKTSFKEELKRSQQYRIDSREQDKKEELKETILPHSKKRKLFISHASADKEIADELLHLLEDIGLNEKHIFYSSLREYSIDLGEDFLNRMKREFEENELMVIFLLSENFYKSKICLCEMGATWVKSYPHIPILLPQFEFAQVEGVLPLSQGFKMIDKEGLNELKKKLCHFFSLEEIEFRKWERKRDRVVKNLRKFKS
jgi:hypothetical protein